ncbi:MAG TPA: MFS transporter [Candidatus Deferrimicrobiaceae bacterium]|nr:MFS transporter [Candidatus Deferrimicrobiaceae bacterium]
MARLTSPVRASIAAVRTALLNDGIRRLEAVWSLGIAADTAFLVVLLVVVYARDGALAAGVLGAVRMGPAVVAGMFAGTLLERFRGRPMLIGIGLIRAFGAGLAAAVIAAGGPTALLFVLAAIVAMVGALVRPIQLTLMPAIARSPAELVAANMAWGTGEGVGTFAGPLIAGLLIAASLPAVATMVVAVAFLVTAWVVVGLRFEQQHDAVGGAGQPGGLRLAAGLRTLRRRPTAGWSVFGAFSQVMTRGLMVPLTVVASIELLGMGEPGVGLLNAAVGFGGLFGAVLALGAARVDRLIRTQSVALTYWGAPLAVIALLPNPVLALGLMVVIGVANAVYDVVLFTIIQRGVSNDERAAMFSVFEAAAGLGLVVGSLLAPVLLEAFGIRGALAVGGAFLPIVSLIIYSRIGRADRVSTIDDALVALLRRVEVFSELPLTAIERISAGLKPVRYAAGEVLMRQGDPGDSFIVVATGAIDVAVDSRVIARGGPGSGVGEIALVRRSPRTATVTATAPVEGYSLDCATFMAAVAGPASAAVTERVVAARLAGNSSPA